MRKVKFRAWDGEGMFSQEDQGEEYFFEVGPNVFKLNLQEQSFECGSGVWEDSWSYKECDKAVFMQFTGLTDKNGVEIYEGDILEIYRLGHKFVEVKFIAPDYKGVAPNEYPYSLNYLLHESVGGHVVGNIHENKDLLNGVL